MNVYSANENGSVLGNSADPDKASPFDAFCTVWSGYKLFGIPSEYYHGRITLL